MRRTDEKNRAVKFRLQSINDRLEQLPVSVMHFGDAGIFSSMGCCQLIRDLSGTASELRFGSFGALLFPIANSNLDLFKKRRSSIDLLKHFRSAGVVLKNGQ